MSYQLLGSWVHTGDVVSVAFPAVAGFEPTLIRFHGVDASPGSRILFTLGSGGDRYFADASALPTDAMALCTAGDPASVRVAAVDGGLLTGGEIVLWGSPAEPGGHVISGGGGGGGGSGIAYVSFSHTANSITPSYPASIAAGNLLLAAVIANSNDYTLDYTPPTGFLPLTVVFAPGSLFAASYLWYKVADGSETGTATFTKNGAGANAHGAFVVRFTGATKIEGLRAFVTEDTSADALVSPAVTTTDPNALIVNLLFTQTPHDVTPPAGWTEQFEGGANNPGASDYSLALHTMPASGTGAQATESPTPGGAGRYGCISFALCTSGSTSAVSPTLRSTSKAYVNNASGASITLPAGAAAGDLVHIFAHHGFAVTRPTGWNAVNALTGSNTNGTVLAKVLSPADVTAGSVSLSFGGTYYGQIMALCMQGCTGGRRTFTASRNATNTSPRTLTTDSSPTSGDYGAYFGGNRANSTNTIDQGSSRQTDAQANASAALYSGSVASSGAITANFTYGTLGSGDYQAVVVIKPAGA